MQVIRYQPKQRRRDDEVTAVELMAVQVTPEENVSDDAKSHTPRLLVFSSSRLLVFSSSDLMLFSSSQNSEFKTPNTLSPSAQSDRGSKEATRPG